MLRAQGLFNQMLDISYQSMIAAKYNEVKSDIVRQQEQKRYMQQQMANQQAAQLQSLQCGYGQYYGNLGGGGFSGGLGGFMPPNWKG